MGKFSLVLLSIINSSVISQEIAPDLIVDRPDITEAAVTIPKGYLQLETGFIYQKQKIDNGISTLNIDNITVASTLLRYGVSNLFEFRFGGEYLRTKIKSIKSEEIINGLSGFFIGTKIQFWKNWFYTNRELIIEFDLPYGEKRLRPDKLDPRILFAFERDINDDLSLGINLGFQKDSREEENILLNVVRFLNITGMLLIIRNQIIISGGTELSIRPIDRRKII